MAIIKNNEVRNFVGLNRDENININNIFQNGSTILSWAVKMSDLENIKCLIEQGANIHQRELGGATPLMLAVHLNRPQIVSYLISRGARVNEGDSYDTPLTVAVRKEFLEIIAILVKNGALVSAVSLDKLSPIFWAIKNGKLEILEILVSKGIPTHLKDEFGNSPFTAAVDCGASKEILQCLLKHGAQINEMTLSWAAKNGNLIVLKALLECGADINVIDEFGNTPLANAVRYKQKEVAKYLITIGANLFKRGTNGETPLFYAIQNKDREMILSLLDHGGNYIINEVIFDAIDMNNLQIIQLLHEKGADLKATDKNNKTLIMKALEVGDVEITKYLFKNGGTLTEKQQATCLLKFLEKKNCEMVKLLIETAANLNVSDVDTPLIKAIKMDNIEMVKSLIQHGADVNFKSRNNRSPLSVAANTNFKIFEYLVEAGATLDPSSQDEAMRGFYQTAKERISKKQKMFSELFPSSNQEEAEKDEKLFDGNSEYKPEKTFWNFRVPIFD